MPIPIAMRLGAHLAHKLNEADEKTGLVNVNSFRLRLELQKLLATNTTYWRGLVGVIEMGLTPPPNGRKYQRGDEYGLFEDSFIAADRYIDLVIGANRSLHASRHTHNGHKFLEELSKRGHIWPDVTLRRSQHKPATGEPAAIVRGSFDRLQRLVDETQGSPCGHRAGVLWLIAGDAAAEVPDMLSLWGAIEAAPAQLTAFADESEHESFVSFLGGAIHGASQHWQWLRRLGLSPPDWINRDEWEKSGKLTSLTANQANNALRWRGHAQKLAAAAGRTTPGEADYKAAWEVSPILKIAFDDFARTPAGRALLSHEGPARMTTFDEGLHDGAHDPETTEKDEDDIREILDLLGASGEFSNRDIAFTRAVWENFSAADILKVIPNWRAEFTDLAAFEAYLEDVLARVAEAIRNLNK